MLERNTMDPDRGSVCLRYVAATMEDADYLLGKILYKDMKGIRSVYRKRYYMQYLIEKLAYFEFETNTWTLIFKFMYMYSSNLKTI